MVILPGPCQIAARNAFYSSCRTTCRPAHYTLRHVRVHLHAHAQRRHPVGCPRHLRVDRRIPACGTSAARTSACPRTSSRPSWTRSAPTATRRTSRSSRRPRRRRSRSAEVAAAIGPDYLIGGTIIEPIQKILEGTAIKFFPYVGEIVGHPCLLRGSIDAHLRRRPQGRGRRRRRHQPARLPLRRRRAGAGARRLGGHRRCRSSAPARSTRSRASRSSATSASGRSRSAPPRSTA